jgi:endonuclease YncB( thermonuclease family)
MQFYSWVRRVMNLNARLLFWGWVCSVGLFVATPVQAWQGVVTHVSDGDTVWVQPLQGGEAYKVRLQSASRGAPKRAKR